MLQQRYVGRGNRLERMWSTGIMNSAGLVYTFVTEYLGFAGFGDEGKVMALAAFGEDTLVERFRDVLGRRPTGAMPSTWPTLAMRCSASCGPSSAIRGRLRPSPRRLMSP